MLWSSMQFFTHQLCRDINRVLILITIQCLFKCFDAHYDQFNCKMDLLGNLRILALASLFAV